MLKERINIQYFGCSHSLILGKKPLNNLPLILDDNNKNYTIINKYRHSTTIKGLDKDKSTTNYNKIILNNYNNVNINIFKLGQVDIEVGYYYNYFIKKTNYSFDEWCNILVNIYQKFLRSIKTKIIIVGISPPAYASDKQLTDYVLKTIKLIDPHDINKLNTELNLKIAHNNFIKFNKYLKEMCDDLNILFFDPFNSFLNEEGILKKEFQTNSDHHLKDLVYYTGISQVETIFNTLFLDFLRENNIY